MQWDPDYHGSVMFVPVVYVTWWMFVMVFSLTGEPACQYEACGWKLWQLAIGLKSASHDQVQER